jgi:hypothetical protein
MANSKQQRQALAVAARLPALPAFQDRAVAALEDEAVRIAAEDTERRRNGGTSFHLVGSGGHLSGFIKDKHTTVRFAGGTVAVTTHD